MISYVCRKLSTNILLLFNFYKCCDKKKSLSNKDVLSLCSPSNALVTLYELRFLYFASLEIPLVIQLQTKSGYPQMLVGHPLFVFCSNILRLEQYEACCHYSHTEK